MEQFPDAHKAGYAVYSKTSLAIYDALVLGLSNRLIWRCPSRHMIDLYNRHLAADHLDIGVGTGYFLDRAKYPVSGPNVTLLDPNEHCLQKAADRIRRYRPHTVQADALLPWPASLGTFGSIALNYVLHCLPGTMSGKAVIFDRLLPHLAEDGVVFGATILQGDVPRSAAARQLMRIYNRKGVFSNEHDTAEALEAELSRRFNLVEMKLIGCVVLFCAKTPKA
ncbi:class I SAM-dependent methyltransferase [Roseibium marinum]|uniref:Methyltransferase family protein n=1 Tax=Roseibium marinum TaxID=281252 RepID=A0A2S3UX63_9HYPH|nr:class I SAM-dependent methyltransferase [Roseibium marinum]POF32133.1 methyltransferase family protein [Roseibium marinum]